MRLIGRHSFPAFILACLLMALVYTQLPLYASNQNQYFLHGMAQAGLGSLDEDWLSNTKEPTPLFTLLIKWTLLILGSPNGFYVIYALLMGLYFWSLMGILDQLLHISDCPSQIVLTATLILLVHSAALRFLLGSTLGANWLFLFDGGVAGQRLLGTVLQPSVFGVLLLAAVYVYLTGKPVWASILAGLSACIHPTYLLTAALLVAGFMLQTFLEDRRVAGALRIGVCALAIVTPILAYTLVNFVGAEEAEQAQRILIDIRLPHHALASVWFDFPSLIKTGMVSAALFLVKGNKKLFIPLIVVFGGTLMLTTYQVITGNTFLALLFPWRPSALLVPLASCVLIGNLAARLLKYIRAIKKDYSAHLIKTCYTILLLLCVMGVVRMQAAASADQASPQRDMLNWVRENSADGDRFLIPINLERFRTFTLRPVYIDFFAIPYKASDVVTWYHRVLAANKFFDTLDCTELYHVSYDGGLNHLVTERSSDQPVCAGLERVYQDDHYNVYQYTRK